MACSAMAGDMAIQRDVTDGNTIVFSYITSLAFFPSLHLIVLKQIGQ
jgi:hypothetical protein